MRAGSFFTTKLLKGTVSLFAEKDKKSHRVKSPVEYLGPTYGETHIWAACFQANYIKNFELMTMSFF